MAKTKKKTTKKAVKREPSVKQKRAMRKLVEALENGSYSTMKDILKDSGYSDNVASQPTKVTKTATWRELMDEYLPDELLAKTHAELFKAEGTIYATSEGRITDTMKVPDWTARKNAIDLAYKVKGRFAPTQMAVSVERKLEELSDEELEAIATGEKTIEDTA